MRPMRSLVARFQKMTIANHLHQSRIGPHPHARWIHTNSRNSFISLDRAVAHTIDHPLSCHLLNLGTYQLYPPCPSRLAAALSASSSSQSGPHLSSLPSLASTPPSWSPWASLRSSGSGSRLSVCNVVNSFELGSHLASVPALCSCTGHSALYLPSCRLHLKPTKSACVHAGCTTAGGLPQPLDLLNVHHPGRYRLLYERPLLPFGVPHEHFMYA